MAYIFFIYFNSRGSERNRHGEAKVGFGEHDLFYKILNVAFVLVLLIAIFVFGSVQALIIVGLYVLFLILLLSSRLIRFIKERATRTKA